MDHTAPQKNHKKRDGVKVKRFHQFYLVKLLLIITPVQHTRIHYDPITHKNVGQQIASRPRERQREQLGKLPELT
ncbi:hypothetical protein VAE122_2910176 [Vibrio aestuarianus]|nr:hypothetical protein VAE122_2910176 [Vibrio aestuarianus]